MNVTPTPRRRVYGRPRGNPKGIGDADSRLRLVMTAAVGYGVGSAWGMVLLGSVTRGLLIGGPLGAVFVAVVARLWAGAAWRAVKASLFPSGGTTAYKRQYSDAEARAQRGDYQPAIAAYQRYVSEQPDDPEPYIRIARLYDGQLGDYPSAALWYRRARTEARIDRGRELLVTQELVTLYLDKLKEPRKAIPELARLVDRFRGTPPATAAAGELARLRERLALERNDWETLTGRFTKGG